MSVKNINFDLFLISPNCVIIRDDISLLCLTTLYIRPLVQQWLLYKFQMLFYSKYDIKIQKMDVVFHQDILEFLHDPIHKRIKT